MSNLMIDESEILIAVRNFSTKVPNGTVTIDISVSNF